MSNDILSIGWCHALTEGSAVYDPPRLFATGKDPSESKRGYLSCPAVRSTCAGLLEVAAPFSLRLSFEAKGGAYMLTPIYPQTSIQPARLRDLIILEPSDDQKEAPELFKLRQTIKAIFDEIESKK